MRRSSEVLGGEPCTSRTWCSDISPGSRSSRTAFDWSTSTAISWPRVNRLCLANVSRCGDLVELVAAGDHLHRAVPGVRYGKGDPSRHHRWKDRMSQSDLDAVNRGIPAIAPRGKGSHETLRWRR